MRVRKKRRTYYLVRLLPHQFWKRLAYGLGLLLAAREAWNRGLGVGLLVVLAMLLLRAVDIIITDELHKRRSWGWENYFDD